MEAPLRCSWIPSRYLRANFSLRNALIRVPFPGYDMNSVSYKAEGTSNFNAFVAPGPQAPVQRSKQFNSALHLVSFAGRAELVWDSFSPGTIRSPPSQLCLLGFLGPNPRFSGELQLYDSQNRGQRGVELPDQWLDHRWPDRGAKRAAHSVYDYTGSVASLYYGTDNEIGNPMVPLLPGVTAKQEARWRYFTHRTYGVTLTLG